MAQTVDDPGFERLAAKLIGVGAVGLVFTSLCYAVAGPEAALPGGSTSVAAAREATAGAAGWMRMAGLIGMPCDVLLAVGAVMVVMTKRGEGAALAIGGWLSMSIAGALFIVIDAMCAFVLAPAALSGEGYAGLRTLFDVLFAIGTWATGLGALAAAASSRWPEFRWGAVRWAMRVAGVVGLAASSAYLLGLPGVPLIGPAIALTAVALALGAKAMHSAPRTGLTEPLEA